MQFGNWFAPPEPVPAALYARLPAEFRRARVTPWSAANLHGQALECFLEGPVFDTDGRLLVTDIPNGRIFRIVGPDRWSLLAEYDGWPNGLKFDAYGVLHVADHKRGIATLDTRNGAVTPLVEAYRSERFRGVNDLHFANNGDLYFTDQGQTGWQDPHGRVFRLERSGRLVCIADWLPSPNGLVLNLAQTQLYVAVTRANAVWRLPLMADGGVSKAGTYLQMSGGAAGPDGIALDREGGLVVAHPGTTVWRFDARGRPSHVVEIAHDAYFTNLAFGRGAAAADIFVTDALRGEVWRARLPVPGAAGGAA
jgi:gluconolactonase